MRTLSTLLASLCFAFAAHAGQPVNVNSASASELADALDGVGAAKAEAIIAYRKEHGAFKSADELANVRGIGLKTVEKNAAFIKTGGATPAKTVASSAK